MKRKISNQKQIRKTQGWEDAILEDNVSLRRVYRLAAVLCMVSAVAWTFLSLLASPIFFPESIFNESIARIYLIIASGMLALSAGLTTACAIRIWLNQNQPKPRKFEFIKKQPMPLLKEERE